MPGQDFHFPNEDATSNFARNFSRLLGLAVLTVIFTFIGSIYTIQHLITPPASFPAQTDVVIEEGSTISAVADQFAATNLVRSGFFLYVTLETKFKGQSIKAGTYRFDGPLSTLDLAKAITDGANVAPPVSVTFPEGFRVSRMIEYLPPTYASEDATPYVSDEGYLFPDTYFVKKGAALDEIVALMRENYTLKTAELFAAHPHNALTERETITLASIVEREANDEDSMRLVAGILMNRLKIGMALQADATLDYLTGKSSSELNEDDLTLDSPFNTYLYPGLPPGPIANPGLTAIRAVLEPADSEYLYYLTGSDGVFHYAKTFEQHKLNKARYLR